MTKKQEYNQWERVKLVQQQFLEYYQKCLDSISGFEDPDHLQRFETQTFIVINSCQNYMRKEILNRNKAISAIEKQVGKLESRIQNSKPFFIGRNKFELRAPVSNSLLLKKKQHNTRQLKNENQEIKNFQEQLLVKINQFKQQVASKKKQFFKGLLPARIQQFEQFQADKSFVGHQCAICIGEYEIGRNMMRLDCDGQHTFCQVCIEGWFAEHNTCPICRHIFE